jgi:hypothetical protein
MDVGEISVLRLIPRTRGPPRAEPSRYKRAFEQCPTNSLIHFAVHFHSD